ncbi:GNAT family N-acetyltransferase [Roseovarius aestuarii]|uniref:Putative phosphinothricin acetyltransferase YwnH n=1 Tax=Roseovarius aestuarii TaxID=475083 RepID=A0A1X7BR54_9RHOB|nr:GNAT family N-acetyltransferase [Roseovarius aestuarii]SMC12075.1 Putative phosphinothricin acetyltransferase YwnH [Roseovarius aestuarii]
MIHVHRAGALDTGAMAHLLNAIIAAGGTTAKVRPVTRDILINWMGFHPKKSAWYVAEGEEGELLGFQYIEPHADLPPDACDIATFVRIGQTGLGIGSSLFDATRVAAQKLGYRWINATIRADNEGGLAYYQSRGFEDYAYQRGVALEDRTLTDKVNKRFDLS